MICGTTLPLARPPARASRSVCIIAGGVTHPPRGFWTDLSRVVVDLVCSKAQVSDNTVWRRGRAEQGRLRRPGDPGVRLRARDRASGTGATFVHGISAAVSRNGCVAQASTEMVSTIRTTLALSAKNVASSSRRRRRRGKLDRHGCRRSGTACRAPRARPARRPGRRRSRRQPRARAGRSHPVPRLPAKAVAARDDVPALRRAAASAPRLNGPRALRSVARHRTPGSPPWALPSRTPTHEAHRQNHGTAVQST